jgi:hypothetical protein
MRIPAEYRDYPSDEPLRVDIVAFLTDSQHFAPPLAVAIDWSGLTFVSDALAKFRPLNESVITIGPLVMREPGA